MAPNDSRMVDTGAPFWDPSCGECDSVDSGPRLTNSIGRRNLVKQVRFLLDPGDPHYPRLREDLHIFYCWCPRQGTYSQGDTSPHDCSRLHYCADRREEVGTFWREYFIFNAAGIPIEKWRLVTATRAFEQCEGKWWELLWRSPFSNSISESTPEVPWGGWSGRDSDSAPSILRVQVCKERNEWKFVCNPVKLYEKIRKRFETM